MSSNDGIGCGKLLAVLGSIAAILGLLIAIFNWLSPFTPVGSSPLARLAQNPAVNQATQTTPAETNVAVNDSSQTGRTVATRAAFSGIVPTVAVTAVPNTVVATAHPPSKATVENQLRVSINVYVNEVYQGQVAAQATGTFSLSSIPATVRFGVIKWKGADGTLYGDDMGGTFSGVHDGANLVVSNIIGDQFYFFPIMNNNSNLDCNAVVNEGHPTQQPAGGVNANSQNVGLGYYKWFSDSNVTVYCGGQAWWWGIRQNSGTAIANVASGTGVVTLDLTMPKATVENQLLVSINVYVNEVYQGQVAAQATGTFSLSSIPATVRFGVIKWKGADGTLYGDDMGGTFSGVHDGANLVVSNIIGDQFYFFPIMNNNSNLDCNAVVNEGHPTQQPAGGVNANSQNVGLGYYKWFSDSNVTVYCGGQAWWWGIRQNSGTAIANVASGTGVVTLTFNGSP